MEVIKPFGPDRDPGLLRVSLCDANPEVARSLADSFRDADGVEVLAGSLFDLNCDALVAPANSFGDMSGGLDQQIDRFYGGAAQDAAMDRIVGCHHGELPVGAAVILAMGTRRFPFLVFAPTMRVPSVVAGTLNAYLSMRAALVAILDHNRAGLARIGSVAVPGLGTGVGGMAGDEAALQMRAAFAMIVLEGWRKVIHPAQAPFAFSPGSRTIHWRRPGDP